MLQRVRSVIATLDDGQPANASGHVVIVGWRRARAALNPAHQILSPHGAITLATEGGQVARRDRGAEHPDAGGGAVCSVSQGDELGAGLLRCAPMCERVHEPHERGGDGEHTRVIALHVPPRARIPAPERLRDSSGHGGTLGPAFTKARRNAGRIRPDGDGALVVRIQFLRGRHALSTRRTCHDLNVRVNLTDLQNQFSLGRLPRPSFAHRSASFVGA